MEKKRLWGKMCWEIVKEIFKFVKRKEKGEKVRKGVRGKINWDARVIYSQHV